MGLQICSVQRNPTAKIHYKCPTDRFLRGNLLALIMLTKKHYIKMAEITNKIGHFHSKVEVFADFVAWIREDGNPNFDVVRFREACGIYLTPSTLEDDRELEHIDYPTLQD